MPSTNNRGVRPLAANDLERVVAIDQAHTGRGRSQFFEKLFAAIKARPNNYLHVCITTGGQLRGFVIARILRGEFGHKDAVAVLDAVGVEPESRERGIGQGLVEELIAVARRQGVQTLHSQASWTQHDMLRFFDASQFELAPRFVLERPITELVEEAGEEP